MVGEGTGRVTIPMIHITLSSLNLKATQITNIPDSLHMVGTVEFSTSCLKGVAS